jgi:arginase
MTMTPTLLGIPFDANSSYLRGSAAAPPRIREALRCDASNQWSENGVNVGALGAFADSGDLSLNDVNVFAEIERGVRELLDRNARPV